MPVVHGEGVLEDGNRGAGPAGVRGLSAAEGGVADLEGFGGEGVGVDCGADFIWETQEGGVDLVGGPSVGVVSMGGVTWDWEGGVGLTVRFLWSLPISDFRKGLWTAREMCWLCIAEGRRAAWAWAPAQSA